MAGLLTLGVVAGLLGPPEGPVRDAEVDRSSEGSVADHSAWEAAGWGAPEPEPEPEPEPPGTAPGQRETPDSGETQDEHARTWESVGWGSPGDSPEPTDSGPAETSPERSETAPGSAGQVEARRKVGDYLSGSLRLTGAYLHFDDEPLVFPDGDDALGVALGRVLVRAPVGEHLRFDFNGFFQLSRSPGVGAGQGSFATAGATRSSYRTRYLGWEFWDSGAVSGQLGVDRASLKVSAGPVQVDVGRFPVNYATTVMFTTNDFFAPFSATAVNTLYKPGVDALRLSSGLGPKASFDVVGVMGYEPERGEPSWGRAAVLARVAAVGGGFEWAALGGKVSQRWVAGGSAQGEAGPLTLRAEFHVGIPDAEGDGAGADDRPIYGRFAVGPGVTFGWQNAALSAEYMYASDGAGEAAGYLDRASAGYSDDLPYLGRHYVGLGAGMEIIPILRVAATVIVSGTDGSGLAGLSLVYSVADESDLIVGLFVPWGKGLRGPDPLTQEVALGSEFGLSPLTAYLEARVFF